MNIDFRNLKLMDALDLAILIEHEAYERYIEFSEQMGHRYAGDAGDFFKLMAGYEKQHGAEISKKRAELFGETPSKVTASMIWDVEAPEEGELRSYMSPYQAMKLAYKSEEKAHDFFDKALASVTDKEVIALFMELRQEEVEHKNLLKEKMSQTPKQEDDDLSFDDIDEPGEY